MIKIAIAKYNIHIHMHGRIQYVYVTNIIFFSELSFDDDGIDWIVFASYFIDNFNYITYKRRCMEETFMITNDSYICRCITKAS